MAKVTVLGTGLVGKAIVLDLARQHEITAVDINEEALANLGSDTKGITSVLADISQQKVVVDNIKNADIVVSAVPGYLGYKTLETIIQNGKDVVDIAFFPEDALALDSLAKTQNVTAIVDMGVAPGLSNIVLGHHSTEMNIDDFKCMVGGLPKYPKPPFNYKAPFSPVDVIEEYTRPARLVRNGKQVTLPALSELELVEFEDVGTLEAFNTDGLRTLIANFPDIPNMAEKTLRYPGHASLIQTLKDIGYLDTEIDNNSAGTLSPLRLSTELFKKHWKLEQNEPEFTVMRINLSGENKYDSTRITYQYDLFDEYDEKTGMSSMARTTGYTCTAAVKLVLEKKFNVKGISPPEHIGKDPDCFQEILAHYTERGISLKQMLN